MFCIIGKFDLSNELTEKFKLSTSRLHALRYNRMGVATINQLTENNIRRVRPNTLPKIANKLIIIDIHCLRSLLIINYYPVKIICELYPAVIM